MSNIPVIDKPLWTPEQIKLIKDVVAKGATNDELQLFLYRCKNMGLDPLKPGQIYFIKYGNSPGTIVVGIEGFRSRAAKTGKQSGINRGVIRDEKGKCIGAFAEIYRKDWTHPAKEEVSLAEYNTGKGNWAKMPETMIKKVAEAAALRMAFPDELGGVYTNEEMDQAEVRKGGVYPEQPDPTDGDQSGDGIYRKPAGTFAKKKLSEIPLDELRKTIENGEKRIEKGFPKPWWWDEFISHAEKYLGDLENDPGFLEEGASNEENNI
jgi:phage recombination protein Bet